ASCEGSRRRSRTSAHDPDRAPPAPRSTAGRPHESRLPATPGAPQARPPAPASAPGAAPAPRPATRSLLKRKPNRDRHQHGNRTPAVEARRVSPLFHRVERGLIGKRGGPDHPELRDAAGRVQPGLPDAGPFPLPPPPPPRA